MILHEWSEGDTPITGTLLPDGMVMMVYPTPRPFAADVMDGRFMEAPREHALVVEYPKPGTVWSCGCPLDGGPNVYGLPCSGRSFRSP